MSWKLPSLRVTVSATGSVGSVQPGAIAKQYTCTSAVLTPCRLGSTTRPANSSAGGMS